MAHHLLFDADALDLDKASGISRLESAEFVHGRLLLVVQTLLIYQTSRSPRERNTSHLVRVPSLDNDIPLEQLQPNHPIHSPLTRRNRARQKLTLRRKEMSIVQHPPQLDRQKLVSERTHVAIEREPLEVHVRHAEDGRARGLVAPPGFHADEPVLDDVDPADTVFPRERVQLEEYVNGVRECLVGGGDLDGETALELDGDAIRVGGRLFDRLGELPHFSWGCGVGVFEDPGFVRDVKEVFVGRPGLGGRLLDGDLFFGGKREKGRSTRETVVKLCEYGEYAHVPRDSVGTDVPGRRHGAMTLMSGLRP